MDLNLPSSVKVEEEKDTLGGRVLLNSNIYPGIVDLCYMDKSDKGAISVNIHFKTKDNQVVRETTYISNRDGEFTYKDKQSGEVKPLPGYSQMDSFFKAVTGKGIGQQLKEEKTISLWDKDAKKELPAKRTVFMDVHQQPIAAGILKVSEEKTTKESNYKNGTGEFFEKNELVKWFNVETGLTHVEQAAGITAPTFFNEWKEKYENKVIERKAKVPGKASAATAGAPGQSAAPVGGAPTQSLFK